MAWQLQCGQEIAKEGSRKECIDFYRRCPRPFPMKLVKIQKQEDIFQHDGVICVLDA